MNALWLMEWEAAHAQRWVASDNGLLYPPIPVRGYPLAARIPEEPASASVIRELEIQINGRVLSVKETP